MPVHAAPCTPVHAARLPRRAFATMLEGVRCRLSIYLALTLLLGSTSASASPSPPPQREPPSPSPPAQREPPRPLPDAPRSEACDGHGRTGWTTRLTVLGLSNPLGGVVSTRVGWCRPLVRRSGILWKLTSLEAGAMHFVTPSFSRQGGYLALAPLSFLVLRVAVSGVWYWPLPGFRAAAYWEADGYDQSWSSDGITNDLTVHKEHGGGLSVETTVVLRGAVGLGRLRHGKVQLIVLNALGLDYWYFPGHDFYYNQRADAVLARSDMALTNNAALLVELPLSAPVRLRLGATDSLAYLPRAGRLAWHQVGGLVMLPLRLKARRVAELTPFLRATAYTHHATRRLSFRAGFIVGVDMAFRVGRL